MKRPSNPGAVIASAARDLHTATTADEILHALSRLTVQHIADYCVIERRDHHDEFIQFCYHSRAYRDERFQVRHSIDATDEDPAALPKAILALHDRRAKDDSKPGISLTEWSRQDVSPTISVATKELMVGGASFARITLGRFPNNGSFDAANRFLVRELAHHATLALENAVRCERERTAVEKLQRVILPAFLPALNGVSFEAAYRSANSEANVGGDWYDAFVLQDGRIGITIGDVTGHGFDAALQMIRMRETLRAALEFCAGKPDEALAFLNVVAKGSETIASALVGVIDCETGLLTYSCAGHPPPLFRTTDRTYFLRGGGVLLGVLSGERYNIDSVTIEYGDTLVLYTDGLVEYGRDLFAGEHRLVEILEKHWPGSPLAASLMPEETPDDVAIIVVRRS
jgi:hypothetical protein